MSTLKGALAPASADGSGLGTWPRWSDRDDPGEGKRESYIGITTIASLLTDSDDRECALFNAVVVHRA